VIDTRLEKFANILVNHSLEIKENDLFVICGSPVAASLIREVYKQALKLGAHPYTQIGVGGLGEIFYKKASDEQLKYVSPISKLEIEKIDARLAIISPENTRNITKEIGADSLGYVSIEGLNKAIGFEICRGCIDFPGGYPTEMQNEL